MGHSTRQHAHPTTSALAVSLGALAIDRMRVDAPDCVVAYGPLARAVTKVLSTLPP